jgi:myo-inositol-hexaphosphate 3-phosphohydrolase
MIFLDVKKSTRKESNFVLNEVKKVELSILDLDNKLIHSENVNSKGSVNRTYDLNALPEGTYFLVAESDKKIAKYEISVIDKRQFLDKCS